MSSEFESIVTDWFPGRQRPCGYLALFKHLGDHWHLDLEPLIFLGRNDLMRVLWLGLSDARAVSRLYFRR